MSFFRLIARRVRAKMMEGYRRWKAISLREGSTAVVKSCAVGKLSLFMRIVRLLLKHSAVGKLSLFMRIVRLLLKHSAVGKLSLFMRIVRPLLKHSAAGVGGQWL